MSNRWTAGIAAVVLTIVAMLYWPVIHGDFVWDDVVNFRWNTWLTEGDQWKHYVFRDFNYWKYYFRPLVVAFFTLQLRLFDGAPGPMHLVSLALHLLNTLLVGLLALRCGKAAGRDDRQSTHWMAVSMLLFGLHPSVIESVAWVGCQYDLLLTSFTLLGLLASVAIGRPIPRTLVVAGCFFLAACTKESAVAFPLVLAIFAWAMQGRSLGSVARPPVLRQFLRDNAGTWAAVLAAGVAYIAFRQWAMGPSDMPPTDATLSVLGHIQMVCFTYMRYWKMLFLPMAGMSPVHEFDMLQFNQLTPASVMTDATAVGIVLVASYFALRRGSALACIALVMSATLLPVLRILSVSFNPNLYHDRYLTCGLAVLCAMLPLLHLPDCLRKGLSSRLARLAIGAISLVWLATSAMAIRTTVPLWANETTLWNWAYATSPNSNYAISNLLELHLAAGRYTEARQLADRVVNEQTPCTNCVLDIAALALRDRDPQRARLLLQVLELNHNFFVSDQRYAPTLAELRRFTQPPTPEDHVPEAGVPGPGH